MRKILASVLIALVLGVVMSQPLKALENCSDKTGDAKARCLTDLTAELEAKIADSQGQQKTLASTISYLNDKIALTTAEIAKTETELRQLEEEIATLSVKIDRLDVNLTEVSKLLVSRIGAAYKRTYLKPFYLLLSTGGFSDFLERNKYLQAAQQNDRNVLIELQKTRDTHQEQKDLKKQKQDEVTALRQKLASQQAALGGQKASKQQLLEITKNDERRYQDLLAAAKAEMAAIQSILAGYGQEVKVGNVNEGDRIATIISGSSACSTGTHLHFELGENKVNKNPANYLKSIDVDWDLCGWWGECDSPFSFGGSWNWPVNGKPRVTQGYGMTGYAKTGAYGGGPHTGIDMVSGDLAVKAVKKGTLYRGSIGCGGGTLRYVKVEQDSNIETYYLHINYY